MPAQEMQAATVLCQRLLYEHFGDQVGDVGSILLERGRLHWAQMRGLLPEKSERQLGICLVDLIQHNCVFHSTSKLPRSEATRDYYEASPRDILARLRHGRVLGLHMQANFLKDKDLDSDVASRLVEALIDHGKLRLGALIDRIVGPDLVEPKDEPFDPMSEDDPADPKGKRKAKEHVTRIDCHNIVRHLLAKRYLRVVTVRSHISEADRELHREAELQKRIQEEYGRLPTARQIQQARAANVANDDLLVEAKEEEEDYAEALVGGKRKANGYHAEASSHSKRFRSDAELNEDCYLRVNVDRYMLATRDKQILEAVHVRYGIHARDVVAAMIAALGEEGDHTPEGNATVSRGLTSQEIVNKLSDKFTKVTKSRPVPFPDSCRTSRTGGAEPGQDTWYRPDDDDKVGLVEEFLQILSAGQVPHDTMPSEAGLADALVQPRGHHRPWVRSTRLEDPDERQGSGSGTDRWRLDWGAIASSLKYAILLDLVRKRFGTDHGEIAVRLVNLVEMKGKMDEKHLCKVALVNPKIVRSVLSELGNIRLLDTQEVARSKTDRSRSIFLYYLDPPSWQATLLGECYQALGNLLTRAAAERAKCKDVLAKLERPDVAGDATLLADGDRRILASLNVKLEMIYAALMRADEDRWILEAPEGS